MSEITATTPYRSPRMGFTFVLTADDRFYCWPCAVERNVHGRQITDLTKGFEHRSCDCCGRRVKPAREPGEAAVVTMLPVRKAS